LFGCAKSEKIEQKIAEKAERGREETEGKEVGGRELKKEKGEKVHVVEITKEGFVPRTIKIKKGEAFAFVNKDDKGHWPASDYHPTHGLYPEKGGCISSKFDACKPLSKNENFTFVFNEIGQWPYHDHLNPSLTGEVIVE
jgi:plastocyanin